MSLVPFVSSSPTPDGELRTLEVKFDEAYKRYDGALGTVCRAEQQFYERRPSKPENPPVPKNIYKDMPGLVLDEDVAISFHRQINDNWANWRAATARLREKCGIEKAEEKLDATAVQLNSVVNKVLAAKADSLDGFRVKLKTRGQIDDDRIVDSIERDVEAMLSLSSLHRHKA